VVLRTLSTILLSLAGFGVFALAVQAVATYRHRHRRPLIPRGVRGISILKPLCGLDDDLEKTLEHFATLPWPTSELLLGVKDTDDAAFPLARRLAQRFPTRVRVVVQRGSSAMNPKVNQLITLKKAARFDLLMVSDSNAIIDAAALDEVVAHFEDPTVGCVANPVSGRGHQSLGALLDNLHLATFLGPGQIVAKMFGRDFIVGKSMTLRRDVLDAMGGFVRFGDYAAEDFAIGVAVTRLGYRNVIARHPVWNVATHRSVRSFFDRYRRWAVLQRTGVTLPAFLAQGLLNPWPLSTLAWVAAPDTWSAKGCALVLAARTVIDVLTARSMALTPLPPHVVPAMLLKDVLLFLAWFEGLFRRTIWWRGNRLEVAQGGLLVRPAISDESFEGAR
jgi:ceramide glucosyltransferase